MTRTSSIYLTALCCFSLAAMGELSAATDSTWTSGSGGNWSPGSWSSGTPNAIGDAARFITLPTSAPTISLVGGPFTVGTLQVEKDLTFTGGGLIFDNGVSTISQILSNSGVAHTFTFDSTTTLNTARNGLNISLASGPVAVDMNGTIAGGSGFNSKLTELAILSLTLMRRTLTQAQPTRRVGF